MELPLYFEIKGLTTFGFRSLQKEQLNEAGCAQMKSELEVSPFLPQHCNKA